MAMSERESIESGYVLVVLAFMLVVLLGFAALAVDIGMMYSAHTAAQRVADAAALAGAYEFTVVSSIATDAEIIAAAETRITNTATQNTIFGTNIQSTELTPAPIVDVTNRRVTVNLSHSLPTFFGGVLGFQSATVSVVAYAEAGQDANCADCVKPWFLPNNILSTLGCGACPPLADELILHKNDKHPTIFAQQHMDQWFSLHAEGPAAALGPGDYYSIILGNDVSDTADPGGAVYRENIATCNLAASIRCGESFNVKTGRMVGPTAQGTSLFISFGITDKPNQLDPYRDSWGPLDGFIPSYDGPASPLPPAISGNKSSSHQLVSVPVWDVCSQYCPTGTLPNGGNTWVTVIGFAKVFIENVDNNGLVTGYLVDVSGCDANPAPCGGSSVFGYPLRLVRMD